MLKYTLLPTAARKRLAAGPSDEFVFEEEVPQGKGHMATIMTLERFAKGYAEASNRYVHESIHGNRKCRLFMDVDGGFRGTAPNTKVNEVAAQIHDLVLDGLKQYGMVVAFPEVMTGCYPGKFSSHLVWDAWFPTPTHCKGFVERVSSRFDTSTGLKIDCAVYKGQTSVGTLRMAYSKKRKLNIPMLPINSPTFSLHAWARTLVTFHEGMASISGLPALPVFVPIQLAVPQGPGPADEDSPAEEARRAEYREITMDWLAKSSPQVVLAHQSSSKIQIRVYCRRAERVHDSNTMHVSARADGRVALHCMGSGCKCDVPMLYSSNQILASALPLKLDWSMM